MPGVARAPFGLGLLIVRGANPRDTGVFIGGEPIPVLYHFLAGPSVFTAQPDRQDRLLPGRLRRPLRPLHRRRRRRHASRATSAARCTARPTSTCATRRRSSKARSPGGVRTSFAVRRSYIDAILPLVHPRREVGSTFVTFAPVYWDYQAPRRQGPARWAAGSALLAYGSSDSLEVLAQDPTVELDVRLAHRLSPRDGRVAHDAAGGWSSRLSATYGYGDQSFSTEHARRLPALPPPLRARGCHPALQPRVRAGGRARLRPQLRLGATTQPPVAARRPHLGTTMPPTRPTSSGRCTTPRRPSTSRRSGTCTPRLRVVPGLRFDYYHVVETDKLSYDPRLALRWDADAAARAQGRRSASITSCRTRSSSTASSATRTCRCRGPTSTRSASSASSPTPTS